MTASTSGSPVQSNEFSRWPLSRPDSARLADRRDDQSSRPAEYSAIQRGGIRRVVAALRPASHGGLREQTFELCATLERILVEQETAMALTNMTVFLRAAADRRSVGEWLEERFPLPVKTYVLQPPCGGAAIALEAWAIGGPGLTVVRRGPHAVESAYEGMRWVHCGGVDSPAPGGYASTREALETLAAALEQAGSAYQHVVRTWFFMGSIIEPEGATQRYKELNRARTDFYRAIPFCSALAAANIPQGIYPASTGIGMQGHSVAGSCLSLQTARTDVILATLENPRQTPAYAYPSRHSPQSPKFSRAIALAVGGQVTTWISGTASILHSESRHPGDVERQTEQTIDNIAELLAPRNFRLHGLPPVSAGLGDLAKIRVYVKHEDDFARCRAICDRRFPGVPAIYAVADICRPELLVEIEGVAFSRAAAGRDR